MSRGPMRPGPWLGLGLVALFALVPLAAGSFRTIDLALKIALFGTLAASYDILLGYTGIVSFGHAMFFGLGAYAVALALGKLGAVTYGHLALGLVAGPVAAAGVSLLVGLFCSGSRPSSSRWVVPSETRTPWPSTGYDRLIDTNGPGTENTRVGGRMPERRHDDGR